MNTAEGDSTNAAVIISYGHRHVPLAAGLIAVGIGTLVPALPVASSFQVDWLRRQTSSGVTVELREPARRIIADIRLLTGLTWEQLAQLLNVSRRSVHFWASGSKIASENRAHLEGVIETLRFIDRGFSRANRTALLAVAADGRTPLDRLAAGEYDAVKGALGRGVQRAVPLSARSRRVSRADRRPLPPEVLMSALEDRVHEEYDPLRPGRGARTENGS